jgi:DNA-binding transcriptional ArsR family regulator
MARKKSEAESKPTEREEAVEPTGRFAYEGLERVIHEKARLGIIASLASNAQGLSFGDLKELCALTDGNLNRHLKVLTDADLVEIVKGTKGNRPQTVCRITREGKARFVEYVAELEKVIADAGKLRDVGSTEAVPSRIGWTMG